MNKVTIYLRTSTEEQNPENQLKDCLNINKYGDYELIEEKQSAFKDKNRIKFNEVLKLIKQRKVNHLIVWDLDRIYRNRKKLIEFFELCKIYNCKIHSFRQEWLEELHKIPEPFNEIMFNLMLQIMGWLAEEESIKKSDRVKNAIRKNKKGITISRKGNKWGRKSIKTKRLKQEVKQLREQGLTIREIAKQVYFYDKSNNKKNPSASLVHKLLEENQ